MDLVENVGKWRVFVVDRFHDLVDRVYIMLEDIVSLAHYFFFFFVDCKSKLCKDVPYTLLHLFALRKELIPELSNLHVGLF